LVTVEDIPTGVIPPVNRVGHQGLFFERFLRVPPPLQS
jgi:hypothetical protein